MSGSESQESPSICARLVAKGVIVHAPAATVFEGIDPDRVEAGVEIFPGCVIRGSRTILGAGCKLGHSGGGLYEDVVVGRGAELYGGVFKDAVFLDGVVVRGNAEMRGGTVMEEGSEVAHHVGLKMTILMPSVVVGSLVNFCDALVAGGTSREDHTEVGSCLALYNFTPWGDKFASMFGDAVGVFLRSPRIFIGGQTQIVSPVKVGYGAVIPAGCAVRRSVPAGRMVGETPVRVDQRFDSVLMGGLGPKFDLTREYVGNLRALLAWYEQVRAPFAQGDALLVAAYEEASRQIQAGVVERVKRLDKLAARIPASMDAHRRALEGVSYEEDALIHERRLVEHESILGRWLGWRQRMLQGAPPGDPRLLAIGARMADARRARPDLGYVEAVGALDDALVEAGSAALREIVEVTVAP